MATTESCFGCQTFVHISAKTLLPITVKWVSNQKRTLFERSKSLLTKLLLLAPPPVWPGCANRYYSFYRNGDRNLDSYDGDDDRRSLGSKYRLDEMSLEEKDCVKKTQKIEVELDKLASKFKKTDWPWSAHGPARFSVLLCGRCEKRKRASKESGQEKQLIRRKRKRRRGKSPRSKHRRRKKMLKRKRKSLKRPRSRNNRPRKVSRNCQGRSPITQKTTEMCVVDDLIDSRV